MGYAGSGVAAAICEREGTMSDELKHIGRAVGRIADAITPVTAGQGIDAAGVTVESLTEAVMGLTAAMMRIAHAIESVADAIRDHDDCM